MKAEEAAEVVADIAQEAARHIEDAGFRLQHGRLGISVEIGENGEVYWEAYCMLWPMDRRRRVARVTTPGDCYPETPAQAGAELLRSCVNQDRADPGVWRPRPILVSDHGGGRWVLQKEPLGLRDGMVLALRCDGDLLEQGGTTSRMLQKAESVHGVPESAWEPPDPL